MVGGESLPSWVILKCVTSPSKTICKDLNKVYCNGVSFDVNLLELEFGVVCYGQATRTKSNKPLHIGCVVESESLALFVKQKGLGVDFNRVQGLIPSVRCWFPELLHHVKVGLTHRLDKATSGIMLLTKTRDTRKVYQRKFKFRSISKSYVAVVSSKSPKFSFIDAALVHTPSLNKVCVGLGRESLTYSRCLRFVFISGVGLVALLWLKSKTGRTHQLRVHCQHIGLPIIGDTKYSFIGHSRYRLLLHASRLCFDHPISRVRLEFYSPAPYRFYHIFPFLKTGTSSDNIDKGLHHKYGSSKKEKIKS
jgi:23S rRNA-/tRNA-specific pseudouridylate synthase